MLTLLVFLPRSLTHVDKGAGPVYWYWSAVAFLLASLGWGTLVNVFAVLVGAWRFRYGLADRLQRGLLPFNRKRDVLILLGYAVMENFFWRPLTLYWRLRGLYDAWRGKSGWEKFARQGFQKHPELPRAA